MIYLNDQADSIFPSGFVGTPFAGIFAALQRVAADVFDVDPRAWRAAVAWGWYLLGNVEILSDVFVGREFLAAALVSEAAPLVKADQSGEDLALLLSLWRGYSPTFSHLEGLYVAYGAQVDVRPVTDEISRRILPLDDDRNAFYIAIKDIDWSRPLTLSEASEIARNATPLGSRPAAYYAFEELSAVRARCVYGDAWINAESGGLSDVPSIDTTAFCLENVGQTVSVITATHSQESGFHYKYSLDNGASWNSFPAGYGVALNPGQKLHIKGYRDGYGLAWYLQLNTTGRVAASGNIASLLVDSGWDAITSLAEYPYAFYRLFYNGGALVGPPDLPFSTLSAGCYYNMFYGCSSLRTAPALPASTGLSNCYRQMFYGCSLISEIRVSLTSGYGANATTNWVKGVAPSGKFYRSASASWWGNLSTDNGIPAGWTVYDVDTGKIIQDPIEVPVALSVTSTGLHTPMSQSFANNNDYWSILISGVYTQALADKVDRYCGVISETSSGSIFWRVKWNEDYNYEVIGVYSDYYAEAGNEITSLDVADFYFEPHPTYPDRLAIRTRNAKPSVYITSLKIRISPK